MTLCMRLAHTIWSSSSIHQRHRTRCRVCSAAAAAKNQIISWDSDYAIRKVPTRAKPQQTTTLLLLPAIRYGLFIFSTEYSKLTIKVECMKSRESFHGAPTSEKGTLWWFYGAYNDAFMGSKIGLKSHVGRVCTWCFGDVWWISCGLS